ncbi:MAG: nickel insertion protein, partial [Chthoniobacterales bacterium]
MAVGALCDLGVDAEELRAELAKLPLAGEFHVQLDRQIRCGIEGTKFDVLLTASPRQHVLKAPAHHGRTFAEIRKMIEGSELSEFVKKRAVAVFQRIAVAEGKIHGMPPEAVHFHEVGAVDSIVDIVGFCVALELLGSPRVLASALVEGTG